jgi:hypothetical protein
MTVHSGQLLILSIPSLPRARPRIQTLLKQRNRPNLLAGLLVAPPHGSRPNSLRHAVDLCQLETSGMRSRIIRPLPYQSCSPPGFMYSETSSHSILQSSKLLSKKVLADCVPFESRNCESSKMHKLHICTLLKKPIVLRYGPIYAYLPVEDGERITLCAWKPIALVGRRHWRLELCVWQTLESTVLMQV